MVPFRMTPTKDIIICRKNKGQPQTIRPRSFTAPPRGVILERIEESRVATPFEDETGKGKKPQANGEMQNCCFPQASSV